ncbi:MAG TPA: glycosyltransferase family 4 protein [Nitrosospira sp.]
MKKVVIFQYRLLHYRLAFFELLREHCARHGIDLHLVHGQATRREAPKKDEGSLSWAHRVENRVWEVGQRDIIWQPFPRGLRHAELVIVMQENRILSNYPLLLRRMLGGAKVGFWGHGANFQSNSPAGLREQWKRLMLTRVDWWFAYTEMTVEIVERRGYPKSRITCLDNAIDNDGFRNDLAAVSGDHAEQLRRQVGGSPIGLFCGSLYPEKRLGFMIEAADRIHAELPDFRLVVIGDGPSAGDILAAAKSRPWMKYVGIRKGLEKAAYFRIADVIFNPGAVGLHVLDAFCSGIPMATTCESQHGPEIAYLKDGHNGIITRGDPEIYAAKVIRLLKDRAEYDYLCSGARASAERYTLRNMVERFTEGMQRCLELPGHS